MAIRIYVEHSVIIATLVSHNRVEIDLGKKALQLLEAHTRFMKRFYGNRPNPSSQAPPKLYVGLRLTRNAVIRVYDDAGNVIETHEHAGEFKEP
jgi:hypothetical protein